MKRSVFMLSAVALTEMLLVLAAVMTVMVVTTAATADTAFAQGQGSRPGIGGPPPGTIRQDQNAVDNPGTDNQAQPITGGNSWFNQ